jgi:anti-sigma factor RsiW
VNIHEQMSALMPWSVNGTLREEDRSKLEAHCAECARCREELSLEQQLYRGMAQQPAVEYMPAASLKKLQNMIDGREQPKAHEVRPLRRFARPSLMAASVAILALALSLLAADRVMVARNGGAASFYTVTSARTKPAGEVIRAVFAPEVTVEQLKTLLDEAKMRIVSGPTEAGVYSLAATSDQPVAESLAVLRKHPDVRFAESTANTPEPGRSP